MDAEQQEMAEQLTIGEPNTTEGLEMAYQFDEKKLKRIETLYKKYRKEDVEILLEEPCCKENEKGNPNYCQFHSFMHKLELILKSRLD